jgi:hypothetical protein
MKTEEVREVEFEVLPPEGQRAESELSRLIAFILDDLIPLPGTKYRVGLDPLIGLIPGIGDASTGAFATVILFQALRAGVPRIVIARMAANILLNALIGAIPGVGDLFSAWFKSNQKNYALLQKHSGTRRASTRGDWIFLMALLSVIVLGVVTAALAAGYMAVSMLRMIFG